MRNNICGSKLLQERNIEDSVAFPIRLRFPSVVFCCIEKKQELFVATVRICY